MTQELRRYATIGVHHKILEWMRGLKRGVVLDVPSGQGAISYDMEREGYKVFCADIERENMVYKNGRCNQLDINGFLPYKDGQFDYVVCEEGIEHIENPHHLVREFARVTTPGGYLVLTTPNVMTIKSRFRFFFYSYLDFFRHIGPIPPEEKHQYPFKDFECHHLNPLYYPEVKYILEKYGFRIDRIETNRHVRKLRVIYPLIKWLVKPKTRKRYHKDPFYTSDVLLEGEHLIYLARRSR